MRVSIGSGVAELLQDRACGADEHLSEVPQLVAAGYGQISAEINYRTTSTDGELAPA